jgi:hypothetical protein
MKYSTPSTARTLVLSTILFVLVTGLVHAQTTWVGGTDLNWSTAANWNPATAPITGQTALLNDTVSANRTIVYDTGASVALGTLTMTQTSGFLNSLDVQKNLTIATAVNLSASGNGTVQLTVDPVLTARIVTFTGGLTVGSGGNLNLLFSGTGTAHISPSVVGNVTLGGGTITVGKPVAGDTGAAPATFNNDLTISSGTVDTSGTGTTTNNVRIIVNGNFTAANGTLTTTSAVQGGNLVLSGATNSFSNFTFAPNYGVMLLRSGDQTLTGLPALNNFGVLTVRGSGTKTVEGTTLGAIQFINSNAGGTLVALKLGSNLTLNSGAQMISMVSGLAATASQLGIDANGHTLDMSAGAGTVWKPNLVTSSSVTQIRA